MNEKNGFNLSKINNFEKENKPEQHYIKMENYQIFVKKTTTNHTFSDD